MDQGPAPAPTTTACGWQKLGCHGWQHPCRLGVSQYDSRILRGGQCRPHSRARVRRPMVDTSYGASNHGARAARWAQPREAAFPSTHARGRLVAVVLLRRGLGTWAVQPGGFAMMRATPHPSGQAYGNGRAVGAPPTRAPASCKATVFWPAATAPASCRLATRARI